MNTACSSPRNLPDLFLQNLPPLPTSSQMRAWDAGAAQLGIPEMTLMENAARAALGVLLESFGSLEGKYVCLYMGSGNNGGDAACLARQVLNYGALPLVVHTRPLRACTGSPGRQVRIARACGVPFVLAPRGTAPSDDKNACTLPDNFLARIPRWLPWSLPDVIVDGLLGTGFRGPLRPDMTALIADINHAASRAFVLALDIPSGLDSLTGKASPLAVNAHVTVSFQAGKAGLYMPSALAHTGRVLVRDIGIPPCVQASAPPTLRLLDATCAAILPHLKSHKPEHAYKNAFGHVLIVGGSPGLSGAAHLAARAALRAGAGLVSVAAPAALCAEIKAGLPDIMTLALDNALSTLPDSLLELIQRCTALVIGPGMGRSADAAKLLHHILALPQRPPAVLDADALHMLPLSLLTPGDILTPHPGEAAALLNWTAPKVQEDRLVTLKALCQLAPSVWVLKGAGTLLSLHTPGKEWPTLLSAYSVPTLAVGGTGDVLSGCIGALLHQVRAGSGRLLRHCPSCLAPSAGAHALTAAALGVVLHAEAGTLLQSAYPYRGNLASQVADSLPQAWQKLELSHS